MCYFKEMALEHKIAALFLKNAGMEDAEDVVSSIDETAALPQSRPGMSMIEKKMDALNKAFEAKDGEAFGAALEDLYSSHSKISS